MKLGDAIIDFGGLIGLKISECDGDSFAISVTPQAEDPRLAHMISELEGTGHELAISTINAVDALYAFEEIEVAEDLYNATMKVIGETKCL